MNVNREVSVDRRPWTALILLCVAQFMVTIDMTVVNVALPSIGRALGFATAADLQWVVTAYVLLSGGMLLLGGRTADLLGRRRMFLVGLLVFSAASLASGLAPSPAALAVSRGAQGLGAALLTPAALSVITTMYAGAQRTAGLAAWGAIGGAGAAAGVLVGGLLTSLLGWEWVFFVNVPIGLAAAVLALWLLPPSSPVGAGVRDLDLAGAATVVAGLVLLVLTIQGGATYGWGSARTLVSLALSAALLVAFPVIESRAARPLVPASMWRVRSLTSGVVAMFGATAIMGGLFLLNSLLLQQVMGASALQAGLAFLPFMAVVAAGSHLGSRALPHLGTRTLMVAGLVLAAGGAVLLARMPAPATYFADILPGFAAMGAGLGLVFVSVSVTAMAGVEHEQSGLASGLLMTGHEVGAAVGVAVLSVIATTAASGAGFTAGYRTALVAAAVIAAVLALFALLVVPAVRPSGNVRAGMHG
jgi:EmrB/QacA subfamily drug resistance transporter